ALHRVQELTGIAAADLSTGELRLVLARRGEVEPALARLAPGELLIARGAPIEATVLPQVDGDGERALVTERDAWEFEPSLAREELGRHFGLSALDGLGISADDDAAVGAAGALLRYLRELQPGGVPHL